MKRTKSEDDDTGVKHIETPKKSRSEEHKDKSQAVSSPQPATVAVDKNGDVETVKLGKSSSVIQKIEEIVEKNIETTNEIAKVNKEEVVHTTEPNENSESEGNCDKTVEFDGTPEKNNIRPTENKKDEDSDKDSEHSNDNETKKVGDDDSGVPSSTQKENIEE